MRFAILISIFLRYGGHYQPALISDQDLQTIRNLEDNLNKVIVAIEPEPKFAEFSESELTNLQQTEKELGVVMLAYEQS